MTEPPYNYSQSIFIRDLLESNAKDHAAQSYKASRADETADAEKHAGLCFDYMVSLGRYNAFLAMGAMYEIIKSDYQNTPLRSNMCQLVQIWMDDKSFEAKSALPNLIYAMDEKNSRFSFPEGKVIRLGLHKPDTDAAGAVIKGNPLPPAHAYTPQYY